MKLRPYFTMELVQKLMKKTWKYLINSPLTEKALTEWPCTTQVSKRITVYTSLYFMINICYAKYQYLLEKEITKNNVKYITLKSGVLNWFIICRTVWRLHLCFLQRMTQVFQIFPWLLRSCRPLWQQRSEHNSEIQLKVSMIYCQM